MKTSKHILFTILVIIGYSGLAQNTTVRATNYDISDNLDLRAVASIFGESRNLEDFERRLNDPSLQISNLDLNNDGRVDYLRVIETIEARTNLIVVQAVLGRDMFQDVATLELERNRRKNMVVQIVGNPYFYGNNYIYEPVYVTRPIIYDYFWVRNYRPYCSPWSWDYYPNYFISWNTFPIYSYRNHINIYVGYNNVCHYSNFRRYDRAVKIYEGRRQNYYENSHPNTSFSNRNSNVSNRYELTQLRDGRTDSRNLNVTRTNNSLRNYETARENSTRNDNAVRNYETTRENSTRNNNAVRNYETARENSTRNDNAVRYYETPRNNSERVNNIRTEQPTRVDYSNRRTETTGTNRTNAVSPERTSISGRRN
ncbi:MAG: hypothetical protein ACOVQ2_01125 [Flavobacterium sp.]